MEKQTDRCLRVPKRGGCRWNLTRLVNQQLSEESDPHPPSGQQRPASCSTTHQLQPQHQDDPDTLQAVAARVSTKLEEGDFKGAVCLACSQDVVADLTNTTLVALKSKHPTAHPDTNLPPAPKEEALDAVLVVSEREVNQAIQSFTKGSAGRPDGLRPQHLFDLTSKAAGAGGGLLLQALTTFTNFLLTGATQAEICPLLLGPHLQLSIRRMGECDQLQLVAPYAGWWVRLLAWQ